MFGPNLYSLMFCRSRLECLRDKNIVCLDIDLKASRALPHHLILATRSHYLFHPVQHCATSEGFNSEIWGT